ncbi:Uncharacterized protein SVXHr_0292 [Halorhabdus sp. SVX81]|uniref:twin-arginine translocation signal domain-containing protein n=1 Tax=Halorhabdus sp. SVX81 TaxID=2978283 RepID=UPI0023D9C11E|nr:twin-arginine translocation signal domain-containing protein [Halorhabdus sp. SVX81]WEL16475.1 Uncharacterized protein SVXHr_0292 [Halorhabdus sp. SVX81]
MQVSRRDLLQTAAVGGLLGVAGCEQPFGSSVRTPAVSVVDTTVPAEIQDSFDLTVDIVESFSADQPARIRVEVQHSASTDAPRQIAFGGTLPFSNYVGGRVDTDDMLVAIPRGTDRIEKTGRTTPVEEWVPKKPTDGCWRAPAVPGSDETDLAVIQLSPGESVAELYTLLGFGQEACLPAGTYEFASTEPYRVVQVAGPDEEWENIGKEKSGFGFTLELADS